MWKQAVFHAGQKHDRELKTLRRVQGHHLHAVLPGIALGIAQQFGAHINVQYQVLAGNVLFLAVLAIRPQGLFGRKTALA